MLNYRMGTPIMLAAGLLLSGCMDDFGYNNGGYYEPITHRYEPVAREKAPAATARKSVDSVSEEASATKVSSEKPVFEKKAVVTEPGLDRPASSVDDMPMIQPTPPGGPGSGPPTM